MTLRQFYDWQTLGGATDVSRLVGKLEELGVSWCMIGGLAVNHWAEEPMATADVDLVITSEQTAEVVKGMENLGFIAKHVDWSINLKEQSKVSIQVSTEDFYHSFASRSIPTEVHGILMRVASLEDTLAGKIKAYSDSGRRPSKRQKDLADLARLLEAHPQLEDKIPSEILDRLEK